MSDNIYPPLLSLSLSLIYIYIYIYDEHLPVARPVVTVETEIKRTSHITDRY